MTDNLNLKRKEKINTKCKICKSPSYREGYSMCLSCYHLDRVLKTDQRYFLIPIKQISGKVSFYEFWFFEKNYVDSGKHNKNNHVFVEINGEFQGFRTINMRKLNCSINSINGFPDIIISRMLREDEVKAYRGTL